MTSEIVENILIGISVNLVCWGLVVGYFIYDTWGYDEPKYIKPTKEQIEKEKEELRKKKIARKIESIKAKSYI